MNRMTEEKLCECPEKSSRQYTFIVNGEYGSWRCAECGGILEVIFESCLNKDKN